MENQPADVQDTTDGTITQQLVYTAAERAVINPYREAYLKCRSSAQRKQIATTKILPALFTYWKQINPNDPRIRRVKESSEVSVKSSSDSCYASLTRSTA